MRVPWLHVIVRFGAASVAVLLLRTGFDYATGPVSIWLRSTAAFGLTKLAGDLVALVLFRETIVLFYEDMFWELLAFVALGGLAAGLIVLARSFIGGSVEPYPLALGVYLVYLVAERRQRQGAEGK